jgi:ribosomal-protein-alanine N-acetyltransferase
VSVRFATEKDIEKVLEIERLSFRQPWDYHSFKLALNDIFLVFEDQEVSGFLIAVCCYRNIRATIIKIAVHPERRRKGIATALLTEALGMVRTRGIIEVCLNVEIVRHPAVELYRKIGFQIMQTIRMDYEDELADDAFYVMKLILAEG